MRILLVAILLAVQVSFISADTQDYVKCKVILKKPNVVYFDAGTSSGVAPGETFQIFYDEMPVISGRIDWADKYISRSESLDVDRMAAIYFSEGLTAKINLFVQQSNRGGTISIPYLSDLNLDPSAIDTPEDKTVARLIHRGLLTRDANGKIVPDLVGDYEIRGLTYTFYLNPEAKFHSGKPVEATDVAYTFGSLAQSARLTPASCYILMIKGAEEFRHRVKNEISGIYIINKGTISVTLKQPFPAFEDYLAGPGGYIIPRPGLESPGAYVIGAGAYKIKWRNPDGLTVVPAEQNSTSAFLDSIQFIRYKSPDEVALSFELGRLDLVSALGEPPPKFVSNYKNTSMTTKTIDYAVLGVNGSRDYQKRLAFSKGLNFLLDRGTIIRVILGGSGHVPDDLVSPEGESREAAFPDSADYYFRSISKLPSAVSLYVDSHYPALVNIARYIAGQLQSRGIKVLNKVTDLSSIEQDRAKSEIDLYLDYFSPVCSDPDCVLYPLYSYSLSGQCNYLYYSDEALQEFVSRLRSETDGERREILAAGLRLSLAKEPPAVILYQPYLTTVLRADISGIRPLDEGYLDLRGAFIEKDK